VRHHWFFDFDGTLADTEADIKAAWAGAIASLGLSCPAFDAVYRTGPTLDRMVYQLFPDTATPELVERMRAAFKPCYDESGFPLTRPYPGAEAWLRSLKAAGCHVYIATNKRHHPTTRLVSKLGWDALLDGCYSFDMYGERLTKTELLLRVLRTRGIAAEDAVMVGDTKGDVDAGRGAGLRTVGCTWGYGTRAELAEADEILERIPVTV